jgi:CTP:molybdopterin cytidylyltransferase MocA
MKNVSALILAGGKSERMGLPKPFLLVDGSSFVEKIAEGYLKFGMNNIVIVMNGQFMQYFPRQISSLNIIQNPHPEYGRFYSLQLGLRQVSCDEFVFVHNVDNPFVEQNVLKKMWSKRTKDGFVVPVHKGRGGHPVLISGSIVKDILSEKRIDCPLRDVLQKYKRVEVKCDYERILANINTWEEYEEQVLNLISEYYSD